MLIFRLQSPETGVELTKTAIGRNAVSLRFKKEPKKIETYSLVIKRPIKVYLIDFYFKFEK